MAVITIKRAETDEELDIVQDMTTYAFEPSPMEKRDTTRREYTKVSAKYLLYEDGTPVSTLDVIPMMQNVRGKVFDMVGIAGVATMPEGRRKGYVKKLMKHSLVEARKNKQVFSTLYPFRQSFYGRFGYISFPHARVVDFSPSNLRQLSNVEVEGKVERVLAKDSVDRSFNYLKSYQEKTHGLSLFIKQIAKVWEKSNFWISFAVVGGKDMGMLLYKTTGFEKSMNISGFFYHNANAKYVLLKHLSLHVDQFSKMSMRLFPGESPETWAYDMKLKICSRDWVPSPMGRILDIRKIGGMQVGEGAINIKIVDEHCEWNNKVWQFRSNNGTLEVIEGGEEDITLTIHGLSAIVYGNYELEDFNFRGWGDVTKIQKDKILNLFPDLTPVMYEQF